MTDKQKAIVVGAGISGLGAAYTLRKFGLNHIVFEEKSRPGGRVVSDVVDGFNIDCGANIFLEAYSTVMQVAKELGVSLERTPVPLNGGLYYNGKFYGFYGGASLKNLMKTAGTFMPGRLLSPKGISQALRFVRMLKSRDSDLSMDDNSHILDLDTTENSAEFFESNFGVEFLERFVQPNLSRFTFGHSNQVGVVYMMIAAWHFGLNGIAWPSIPKRGLGEFIDALVRADEENIFTSMPVERIVLEEGTVRGVVTDFGFVEADTVICATTATTALDIAPDLPQDIRDVLRRVTYSKCCRVVFGLETNPFPEDDWYAIAFPQETGALMTGMSNPAVLAPETVPAGKHLVDAFVIGERAEELFALSDAEIEDRVVADVRKCLPAMPEKPLFTRVYRWHEAVCLAPGGMMTALNELGRRNFPGVEGLFLAGEYMGVPSTNGALRSGIQAATGCIASGFRASLAQ